MGNPISAKVDFCNTSLAKCCFLQSQTSSFKPKDHQEKETWGQAWTNTLFWSKVPKKLSKAVPKSTQKLMQIWAWTSKCPLLYSPVSQDHPWVPRGAKAKPPRMPNDRSGYQRCQDPLATTPRICNPSAMSNDRGPTPEGVAHKILKFFWGDQEYYRRTEWKLKEWAPRPLRVRSGLLPWFSKLSIGSYKTHFRILILSLLSNCRVGLLDVLIPFSSWRAMKCCLLLSANWQLLMYMNCCQQIQYDILAISWYSHSIPWYDLVN